MSIPPLLDELLRAPGASGHEDAVQAIVRREAAAFGAEVERDVFGTTVATIRGSAGRLITFVAHADQVGFFVRGADENGLLTIARASRWKPEGAWRQRVRIGTADGELRGVVTGEWGTRGPTWESMRVDIGAATGEEALSLVCPGDPIVLAGAPEELLNGRVISAALDDRAGVYASLEALRRLAARPAAWDVAVLVSTQEESGSYPGATTAVHRTSPDVAIVVEVTYASGVPGVPAWGDVRLGGGPAIARIPVISPLVSAGLISTAKAEGIPFSVETGSETWSDADGLSMAGDGIACGMVSIPLRYMHSAGEIAHLADIEAASSLIEAYARSLTADSSFLR
ncbi:MAG: M42 family peptidase [Thermoleophilia bacterium]